MPHSSFTSGHRTITEEIDIMIEGETLTRIRIIRLGPAGSPFWLEVESGFMSNTWHDITGRDPVMSRKAVMLLAERYLAASQPAINRINDVWRKARIDRQAHSAALQAERSARDKA